MYIVVHSRAIIMMKLKCLAYINKNIKNETNRNNKLNWLLWNISIVWIHIHYSNVKYWVMPILNKDVFILKLNIFLSSIITYRIMLNTILLVEKIEDIGDLSVLFQLKPVSGMKNTSIAPMATNRRKPELMMPLSLYWALISTMLSGSFLFSALIHWLSVELSSFISGTSEFIHRSYLKIE